MPHLKADALLIDPAGLAFLRAVLRPGRIEQESPKITRISDMRRAHARAAATEAIEEARPALEPRRRARRS
jgi:hypothetical protein